MHTSSNEDTRTIDTGIKPNESEIWIKGARSNNLKNIEVRIPKNKLIVVTGLSGSGKSSLIMDTLFAEGQRRYVESLSSYARQFLDRMKKPEVDFIKGICPAIAIEQRVGNRNARSTVGSMTELFDLLRLLYARIGKTISPVSGELVKKDTVTDVIDFIRELPDGKKLLILSPFNAQYGKRPYEQELQILKQKGYTRLYRDGEMVYIEDALEADPDLLKTPIEQLKGDFYTLIDRVVTKSESEENEKRIADSVQTAFSESEGICMIQILDGQSRTFSNRFELDGITFLEPSPQLFNYNNPYGACPKCEGYGKIIGIDEDKVIPDKSLSVFEGAIACWNGDKGEKWLRKLITFADHFSFPIHRPIEELSPDQYNLLWEGNSYFRGIDDYFDKLSEKTYKIQNRVILARYRGRTKCNLCHGQRLRKEATYIKVGGRHLGELINIPIDELLAYFDALELDEHDRQIASRLLLEIDKRLKTMVRIGLGYLSLDRASATLSGGETQRINLTRTLGSNLSDSLYILDEPSIGLHPKDSKQLVNVLQGLRDLNNTVIVVEHEEEIIHNADHIMEIGPGAGVHGGEVVFNDSYDSFLKRGHGHLTSDYLTGKRAIPTPIQRRSIIDKIILKGASEHNLQHVDISIPLNAMTVVTGVSGSGKTTLIKDILYPELRKWLGLSFSKAPGASKGLEGDLSSITQVEMISQNPIGRSSRSNPVTYIKAYDVIRRLMVKQPLAKIRGYKPKHFSFNVEGGRCEQCKGDGTVTIEMQFLADVTLTCDECKGKRFKDEILEVQYMDKNIYDILNLSVEEAMSFFSKESSVVNALKPLEDVGLGYISLGQPSSTLSGGEAQRVKLASYLSKEQRDEHILFIFDEPTTGLHFHDINKLMAALDALIERGHSVVIIEHNMDVIKCADWVIDLGPGGGKNGGKLLFEGRPEDLIDVAASHTGKYLKEKLTV